MTQLPDKDAAIQAASSKSAPGGQVDKDPPAPLTLPEERENPGDGEQGSSGVGAPKPTEGSRTADDDV